MSFFRAFFFYFLVMSICQIADARIVLRCESVFSPTLSEIFYAELKNLEKTQIDHQSIRLHPAVLKKVRKFFHQNELTDLLSRGEVSEKAEELTQILFEKELTLEKKWLVQKSVQDKRRTQQLLLQALLERGFQANWAEPAQILGWDRFRKSWNQLKISKVYQFSMLPWFLPKVKGPQVSPELLIKIIDQGLEANIDEVHSLLARQNRHESYLHFRRLYTPVILGSLFLVQSFFAYEALQELQEQKVQKAIQDLQKAGLLAEAMIQQSQSVIIENAYQETIKEFEQTWGEPPTAEEKQQIRDRIILHLKKLNLPSE